MKTVYQNIIIAKLLLIVPFLNFTLTAQEYLYLNTETNLKFEKSQYLNCNLHSSIKPFVLSDSSNYDSLISETYVITQKKRLNKLLNDNLLNFSKSSFSGYVNPILTIEPKLEASSNVTFNSYHFGFSLGAKAGKKLAFQLNGFYGISSFPSHIESFIDSVGIIPRFGKYHSKTGENYHYYNFSGYLSYSPWKYLNLQAGVGKNFWGEGYRSLFLSDNANNYPFLKATVDVWKFKYIWMFSALSDYNSDYQDNKLRDKFLFSHYLSWNATKWLNLNFFESIVSNPIDSAGVSYFNLNYLNPVIFLRPVEFAGGSADNAILGFGIKLKLWKKYQFYSQFIIDEFVFSELSSKSGWWGNKYGIQAGLKVFNLFNLKNLFGRIEYNQIRPFTYSYSNSIVSYGNHYQAMAHPSGANLEELILQFHYHIKRYSVELKTVFCKTGMDINETSYGRDIYKSYELRQSDYGNTLGQGFNGSFSDLLLKMSWLVNPKMNLSINLSLNYQEYHIPNGNYNDSYISLGIKTLIQNESIDFIQ